MERGSLKAEDGTVGLINLTRFLLKAITAESLYIAALLDAINRLMFGFQSSGRLNRSEYMWDDKLQRKVSIQS